MRIRAPPFSLNALAVTPRTRRDLHASTVTLLRGRSRLIDTAVVLEKPPPWPKPPEPLQDPSPCQTYPLEHCVAHAHHRTGLCHSLAPFPHAGGAQDAARRGQHLGEALAATLTPLTQSPWPREVFPLPNRTPAPPWGLTVSSPPVGALPR